MNYILMRIRARYAEMILSGRKTLEIRKTAPEGTGKTASTPFYSMKASGTVGAV